MGLDEASCSVQRIDLPGFVRARPLLGMFTLGSDNGANCAIGHPGGAGLFHRRCDRPAGAEGENQRAEAEHDHG